MGRVIPNLDETRNRSMACLDKLEAKFAAGLENLVHEVDTHIKSLTPVWSGQTVRNYIWTEGTPFQGVLEAIDNGPTGRTNSMVLGTEPRRHPNEAAAAESLTNLNFTNPFKVYVLANNAPDIEGLELGALPGPPLKSRSPNGMFKLVETFVNAKIAAKGIL